MKTRLKSIHNIPFLVCLALLLLNDFYLKAEYHNWLTGKLSDFCGLFVFVSFWTALFPDRKQTLCVFTALLFVIWKSPYSQVFIDFFCQNFYPIHRVVDVTDLMALSILPIAYFLSPRYAIQLKLHPLPLTLLSVFSFCATSIPQPTQKFEHPQYLLFKTGIISFQSSEYPGMHEVYELDSIIIIGVQEIGIDKPAPLDDDFQKVLILKDLDLRLIRESKDGHRAQKNLADYKALRDSLIVGERTTITLKLDSVTDYLNFKNTRLDGDFQRFFNDNRLITGKFKNGIEDSVWTFYNSKNEIVSRKYFKNGELIKTEAFENAALRSAYHFNSRAETIRNKYFHLAIIAILMIALLIKLYLNYKRVERNDFIKLSNFLQIAGPLVLPFVIFALSKSFSSLIPSSYSTVFLGIFGEALLIYIVSVLLWILIFYYLKLRTKLDLMYYILLISLAVVLVEEWIFLKNII